MAPNAVSSLRLPWKDFSGYNTQMTSCIPFLSNCCSSLAFAHPFTLKGNIWPCIRAIATLLLLFPSSVTVKVLQQQEQVTACIVAKLWHSCWAKSHPGYMSILTALLSMVTGCNKQCWRHMCSASGPQFGNHWSNRYKKTTPKNGLGRTGICCNTVSWLLPLPQSDKSGDYQSEYTVSYSSRNKELRN